MSVLNYNKKILFFPVSRDPLVSIIVPVFNNQHLVLDCLTHILQFTKNIQYEVIVADDHSTEDMSLISSQVKNIQIVRQSENLGFIKNCNAAASQARGQYLVFLNSDTEVQKDWLYWLLHTYATHPKAGVVTGLLLYPDRTIETAGNIIFRDGSAFSYGRGDMFIESSEYQYVKEVDYASAACLMIKTALWQHLGGFDEFFAPAYYEDTDLSFKVRQQGFEVLYQPKAEIIHKESQSYTIQKSVLLDKNKILFAERWHKELARATHVVPLVDFYTQFWFFSRVYFQYRDRSYTRYSSCILLYSPIRVKMHSLDRQIMGIQRNGHDVTVCVLSAGALSKSFTGLLRQRSVNILDDKNMPEWLSHNINNFDDIYVSKNCPELYLKNTFKYKKKTARVIFDNAYTGMVVPALVSAGLVLFRVISGLVRFRVMGWKSNACAIISRKEIYPACEGMAAKVSNTFEHLSRHFDFSILITESPETYFVCRGGIVYEYALPVGLQIATNWLKKLLRKNSATNKPIYVFPEYEQFLEYPKYDFDFRMRVLYLSCCYGITLFQAEFFCFENTLGLVKKFIPGCKSLISQHNIEAQRLPALYPCTVDQVAFMRKYEIETCNKSNGVLVVSSEDASSLRALGELQVPLYILPLGVDLHTYNTLPVDCRSAIRRQYHIPENAWVVIFHGILNYAPNTEAADFLVKELLPVLKNTAQGDFYVMLVGKYPPQKYIGFDDKLIVTDVVDNIAEVISAADVAVLPLLQGGGMRLKILEYFAAKIPVISTAKGAQGIPVKAGQELLIAETAAEMIDKIIELKDNREKYVALKENAYNFVQDYDWAKLVARNVEFLKRI